ncbi:aspartyl protease family protein [Candidatus Bipolaricaulota bacterium]|nr:aspartyl protease family protein [Candidatus Bipolaricaulota bacterium]
MKKDKSYKLHRQGNLLILRAAVGGIDGSVVVLRLLLDTGASYTMLPVEAVEAIGCDTHHPLRRAHIITANGVIVAPVVAVPWFHCLGQCLEKFPVVAHTLPPGAFVDGLLGMDFLVHFGVTIDVSRGEVILSHPPN